MPIIELEKSEFYKCNSIINHEGHIEVKAVVSGVNPGRIFVDNYDSPKTGLIWLGNNDGFIFIGDPDNNLFTSEINEYIDSVIAAQAIKIGLKWFEGVGNHEEWNHVLEKMFKHRPLGKWNQRVYTLQNYNNNEPAIDGAYRIIKLTKASYESNSALKNSDFLNSKLLTAWSSIDDFFQNGKGFCIIHNDEVVSICFSEFVAENVYFIAIETVEAHRRRNLGLKIAHQFVQDCIKNNLIPYWDCMESNKPSIAIAEKLGLTNKFNYIGYEFPFENMVDK